MSTTCEICGQGVEAILEHRAETHGVMAQGVGEAGTVYYVPLQTLDQVKKPAARPTRSKRK